MGTWGRDEAGDLLLPAARPPDLDPSGYCWQEWKEWKE